MQLECWRKARIGSLLKRVGRGMRYPLTKRLSGDVEHYMLPDVLLYGAVNPLKQQLLSTFL